MDAVTALGRCLCAAVAAVLLGLLFGLGLDGRRTEATPGACSRLWLGCAGRYTCEESGGMWCDRCSCEPAPER